MKKINVAITGASGAIYARLLVARLIECNSVDLVRIIFTKNGEDIMRAEQCTEWDNLIGGSSGSKIEIVSNKDFYVSLASGSGSDEALIVVPCSMGMLSRIANGISDDLIARGADVMLKERRKLIVVTREAPYNIIHINNMLTLTQAGGVIVPASPSFYSNPQTIEDLCDTTVDNIMRLLGFSTHYHWQE